MMSHRKPVTIFAVWYFLFGIGAFFPDANAPFFTLPMSEWSALHRSLLAFSGLYTVHVALWAFLVARLDWAAARQFCVILAVNLTLMVPGVAAYLQLRSGMFTPAGLSAFFIDFAFGIYFWVLVLRRRE
jgi:hypothetical protein